MEHLVGPGQSIDNGRYELRRELGRGAMGVVYLAFDARLQREVVVKMLAPELAHNPRVRQRFRNEGLIQGNVVHPNIVRATDVVDEPPVLALVMDYVGEDLESYLRTRGGHLPFRESWALMQPVMAAVHAAHEAGVVHRDLKPANILLEVQPHGLVPQIADFGVAKLVADSATGHGSTVFGTVLGTPAYMPPEQLRGQLDLDGRADVYALGVVFYELLTGQVPYGHGEAVPRAMASGPAPAPPSTFVGGLPSGLDTVLARAMSLERDRRYPTVHAFAADIAATASGRAVSAPTIGVAPPAGAGTGPHPPAVPSLGASSAPEPDAGRSGAEPGRTGRPAWLFPGIIMAALALGGFAVAAWTSGEGYPHCDRDADCKGGEVCRANRCGSQDVANKVAAAALIGSAPPAVAASPPPVAPEPLGPTPVPQPKPTYPGCRTNGDCRGVEECKDERCGVQYPRCGSAADCRAGEECADNTCRQRAVMAPPPDRCAHAQQWVGHWRTTTVVYGDRQSAIGVNGYYTMDITVSGCRVTVRMTKTGYSSAHRVHEFAPGKRQFGSAGFNSRADGAGAVGELQVTFRRPDGGGVLVTQFYLRVSDGHLSGWWHYDGESFDTANFWGTLRAAKGYGGRLTLSTSDWVGAQPSGFQARLSALRLQRATE